MLLRVRRPTTVISKLAPAETVKYTSLLLTNESLVIQLQGGLNGGGSLFYESCFDDATTAAERGGEQWDTDLSEDDFQQLWDGGENHDWSEGYVDSGEGWLNAHQHRHQHQPLILRTYEYQTRGALHVHVFPSFGAANLQEALMYAFDYALNYTSRGDTSDNEDEGEDER